MDTILFVVAEDSYFVSHRLHLAQHALDNGYRVVLITHGNKYKEIIEKKGINVYNWNINRSSINIILEVYSIVKLRQMIKDIRPKIVHAVAMKPVLYSSIACKGIDAIRCVFALGGLGFIFSSQKRYARFIRPLIIIALRYALSGKKNRLILQNIDDQHVIIRHRIIAEEQIRLIRGAGVNTSIFSPQPEAVGLPLVVLPGRMLWDKGIGDFVECARAIKAKGIAARFALVGDPDEHNPECVPRGQLEAWKKEGVVEWWGYCDDIPEVLRQAAIVCLPSYGEGLPKALLEAASCGRPIVTYDVSGCREVVVHERNGLLVPLKDGRALAAAVEKLLHDPELRMRMGRFGREMVIAEFAEERIARETMRVWEEVRG